MITNAQVLTETFGYDKDDLEFEKVKNNLEGHDLEYGIEVIFNYYRRNGFPHYHIEEGEKQIQMDKLIRFNHNSSSF